MSGLRAKVSCACAWTAQIAELGENVARIKLDKKKFHNIEAVVDRLVIDDKIRVRLGDSVETALRWGEGVMFTLHQLPEELQSPKSKAASQPIGNRRNRNWIETLHSNKMCSPATGKSFDPPTPKHFSFNAPAGACPVCHGLGQKMIFDEASRRARPGRAARRRHPAVAARGQTAEHLLQGHAAFGRGAFQRQHLQTPCKDLPDDFKKVLLNGSGEDDVDFKFWRGGKVSTIDRPFEGVLPNLERLATESESEFVRNRLKQYMSRSFATRATASG